jgi:head-tail adaptor
MAGLRPRLRRRLVLEDAAATEDSGGGRAVVWVPLGVVWADVRAVSGTESLAGDRDLTRVTHRILVRAAPAGSPARPRADQRFREGSRVFALLAVAEADPRGRYLICWAEEGSGS